MRRVTWLAVPMALAAMLSACGGSDDGDDDSQSATDPSEDAFCSEAKDIVGSGEIPDQETVQKLADAAPDEIADDFQVLADAMREFESAKPADVKAAQANIQSWGDEHCIAATPGTS